MDGNRPRGRLSQERAEAMKRSVSLAILMAVALTACQSYQFPTFKRSSAPADLGGTGLPPDSEPGIPMASQSRFPDVPVPLNVKEDTERTYVYESPGLQIGRLVYTSRNDLAELAQFYVREAPATGWTMQSIQQAGAVDIVFTKPGKRLNVTVRDLGMGRGRQLILNYTPDTGRAL